MPAKITDYTVFNAVCGFCVKVSIPEMLLWYRGDFVGEKGDQYLAEYEGLLNFIAEHTPASHSDSLRRLLNLDSVHGYGENIGEIQIETVDH